MKYHCINHKDRPQEVGNKCWECSLGREKFIRKFGKIPEEHYKKWSEK